MYSDQQKLLSVLFVACILATVWASSFIGATASGGSTSAGLSVVGLP